MALTTKAGPTNGAPESAIVQDAEMATMPPDRSAEQRQSFRH